MKKTVPIWIIAVSIVALVSVIFLLLTASSVYFFVLRPVYAEQERQKQLTPFEREHEQMFPTHKWVNHVNVPR